MQYKISMYEGGFKTSLSCRGSSTKVAKISFVKTINEM